jgi:hypothetical protein
MIITEQWYLTYSTYNKQYCTYSDIAAIIQFIAELMSAIDRTRRYQDEQEIFALSAVMEPGQNDTLMNLHAIVIQLSANVRPISDRHWVFEIILFRERGRSQLSANGWKRSALFVITGKLVHILNIVVLESPTPMVEALLSITN